MLRVRPTVRRLRVWGSIASLLMYLLVVQSAGFLHHDPQCHRASRTHCTSCSFTLSASGVADDVSPRIWRLPAAERLIAETALAFTVVPRVFASDSSPPLGNV